MKKTELLQQVKLKLGKKDLEEMKENLSSSLKDTLDDLKINVMGIKESPTQIEIRNDRNSWSKEELKRLSKEKSFIKLYCTQQESTLIFLNKSS
ncbi:hypothetical protein N9948_00675 [bacterium]|nr:hypothetical protein [bacterium]